MCETVSVSICSPFTSPRYRPALSHIGIPFTCNQPQYLEHRFTPAHCRAVLGTMDCPYCSLLPDPQKPNQLPISAHFYLCSIRCSY